MSRSLATVCLVLGLLTLASGSADALKVADEYPTVGVQTTIELEAPVDEITVTYQPGAPIETVQRVETGGQSKVLWTPEKPGVATIKAGPDSKNISVKFDGVPTLGLFIFLGAGLVLIGGATICLRALFSESHE